ncbi:alpha/beta hydrolase [Desulfitobacterium sp. THU1]|uniref:alpha/beta hydrolase n=1 Tax=Desulfitobacterium sp. THU1 TaxID=3138072 RepID=UPI00311F9A38
MIIDQIHPELKEAFLLFPESSNSEENIQKIRAARLEQLKKIQALLPKNENVTVSRRSIPGLPGDPDVTIYIFQPIKYKTGMPGILHIHGGGLVMGSTESEEYHCVEYASTLNCTVISPEYRLAPEHKYPAAVNDCYATLIWFAQNATELDVDADNIIIDGGSAGGCLSAATTIMARDKNGPKIAAQSLLCPMLDCRCNTPSCLAISDKHFPYNYEMAVNSWKMYLGEISPDDVSPYASPSLLKDYKGLPPAVVSVGQLDLFRDETINYVQALQQAGVQAELHVYPGCYHAAEAFGANTEIVKRNQANHKVALSNLLNKRYF